jgi:hypothetical protein
MTLAAGSKLGPYEIVAPIGEAYRASNTKWQRTSNLRIPRPVT